MYLRIAASEFFTNGFESKECFGILWIFTSTVHHFSMGVRLFVLDQGFGGKMTFQITGWILVDETIQKQSSGRVCKKMLLTILPRPVTLFKK